MPQSYQWHPYMVANTRLEQQLAETVRRASPGRDHIEVLDYGCGHGIRAEKVAEYLRPRRATVYLYDVDSNLIAAARQRLSKTTAVQMFSETESSRQFELILCLSVLEVLPDEEIARVLRLFHDRMRRDSLLIVQHVNWHPLAARTCVWFAKSLASSTTFGSASRTHASRLFPRTYAPLSRLLGQIDDAGLHLTGMIRGPYIKQIYLPVPASMTSHNLLLVSR